MCEDKLGNKIRDLEDPAILTSVPILCRGSRSTGSIYVFAWCRESSK